MRLLLRIGIWATALWIPVSVIVGQSVSPEPFTFLTKHLGFSSTELAALDTGQVLVKLPKTTETREVAAFAIARLDIPANLFVEKVRDIENFKKGKNVLQIGKFQNPPRLADLDGLTVDQADIDSIKRCRVKNCDVKMSAEFIEKFRNEVDWSAPKYRDRVTQLVRQMLLEQLQEYLKGGNAALVEYADKSYSLQLADEMRSLLKPVPFMYGYGPLFQRYLEDFPSVPTGGTSNFESFAYWSKEDFGVKPVITITHLTISRSGPHTSNVVIVSKGIYASHYLESSLGLTALVRDDSHQQRSYLMYTNRSRTDALRGMFAGMKRSLIGGRLRDGARKSMQAMKTKLEAEYEE